MAVYYVWSGASGSGNGSSWANAALTLTAGFVLEAAGDTLYVAHDHAESTAASITLTSSGTITNTTKIVCVNRAGSVPPVSADRRTTATVTTTGISNITFAGFAHYDGIIFSAGTGGVAANIVVIAAGSQNHRFDNCSMRLGNTGTASITLGGNANGGVYVEFNNTTASFANAGQLFVVYGRFKWRNTPSALLGTIPATLFVPITGRGGSIECIGVDFSAAGSGKTLVNSTGPAQSGSVTFIDCKLHASVTKTAIMITGGTWQIDFIRSGSAGVSYNVYSQRLAGALFEELTIIRTGGATDGTTGISWRVDTTPNCTYSLPFECPPIVIWNDTTGSAKTATVECVASAIMTDQEIWVDVEYLGDASSPQGSFVNDGKADLLATAANQTSSSATWGGSTTKFKLDVTFTAQQKGWIYARVKVGKASSTVYIDPLVTLT